MLKKPGLEELVRELERDYARWEQVYMAGSKDPFWPDGVNANLCRNHILCGKRRIRDLNRSEDYCRRVEQRFLRQVNEQKPQSLDRFKSIWYNGRDGSNVHYHASRYHALNLHSVFQKGTVEFRMFNSTLHAGKVKTYIQFSLAIANQALTQRTARAAPTRTTNDRYTFRAWLLRLGMIGPEFETARFHLLSHLEGNIAWRDPSQLIREQEEQTQHAPAQEPVPAPGLSL